MAKPSKKSAPKPESGYATRLYDWSSAALRGGDLEIVRHGFIFDRAHGKESLAGRPGTVDPSSGATVLIPLARIDAALAGCDAWEARRKGQVSPARALWQDLHRAASALV